MKVYAKIYCCEGVVFEKKYDTEAEAQAFVDGYKQAHEMVENEIGPGGEDPLDYYDTCVDSEPASEE